jgi:hypothetical protein
LPFLESQAFVFFMLLFKLLISTIVALPNEGIRDTQRARLYNQCLQELSIPETSYDIPHLRLAAECSVAKCLNESAWAPEDITDCVEFFKLPDY